MRTKEYWRNWAKAAGVRAVKTVAQTAIGAIGASVALGDVNWPLVASTAALSGIVSVLTSVAGLPEVPVTEKQEEQADENGKQRDRAD